MNDRERLQQIAHFERPGDPFEFLHAVWPEAVERWQTEGLPKEANVGDVVSLGQDRTEFLPFINLFRFARGGTNPPYLIAIVPWFKKEVIGDEGETEVIRDEDGVLYREHKNNPGFPQFLDYPVKDRATWNEYKKRLQPDTPGRWPEGWDRIDLTSTAFSHDARLHGKPWGERDFALGMYSLSLMGLPRNMMGLENYSIALHENRSLVEDMADHMLWWNIEMHKKVFAAGIQPDFVWMWEDICYKSGPLFSPKIMREIMVPRWRVFTDFLRSNGVDFILVDCDGNVEEFVPLMLEGGINALFPFEVAADNDILAFRKKYGKNLIITGGIDKRALAEGKPAIDAELEKVKMLLAEGGYFPTVDHHVPPDISFQNYMYYKMRMKSLRTAE